MTSRRLSTPQARRVTQGRRDDPYPTCCSNYSRLDAVLGYRPGDRTTSFLPSAHIADRIAGLYSQELFGAQITTVADPRAIASALTGVRPTVWAPYRGCGKN